PVRQPRPPARQAGDRAAAGRSDRRYDCARRCDRQRVGEAGAAMTARPVTESGWQRALRSLLYGRDVDRNVKAKARLGLAILAFACIYGVIALRLVMFAEQSDG